LLLALLVDDLASILTWAFQRSTIHFRHIAVKWKIYHLPVVQSGSSRGFALLVMSEEDAELETMVKEAAGILAITHGKVKIVKAMEMAGFRSAERKNMKLYQRVRRLVPKCHLVVDEAYERKAAPEVVATVVTVNTADKLSQDSEVSSITGDSGRIIRRRSSKEVQRAHAKKILQDKRETQAMKQVTVLIERSKALPIGHPAKHTIKEIVAATNAQMNTNVSGVTAARYVLAGLVGVSPLKRGAAGDIQPMIYDALKGALATYLKLEQAASKKQSTVKQLSLLVNACVNKGGYQKTRADLTRRLKKDIADHFEVGKANVVEQRRLMWTTAYNLEVWFKTWKNTLIELGFGRAKTEADAESELTEGEVVFFVGQRNRIDRQP
jgi:hypothetical protein